MSPLPDAARVLSRTAWPAVGSSGRLVDSGGLVRHASRPGRLIGFCNVVSLLFSIVPIEF